MLKWYEKTGSNDDIVISSRIRIARNFSDYHFFNRLDDESALKLVNSVIGKLQTDFPDDYSYYFMNSCSEAKKKELKEKREISAYMVNNKNGALALSKDEGVSVMVNSEDHIRIQALSSGMNIKECFSRVNEVDDYIDTNFNYAFDEKYGYKTAYPTNVGTGMRASYTLHLPALAEAKKINEISAELGRFGIKFKMPYGDNENRLGNLYQVSSQRTLGQSELAIIKDLDDIVAQLIDQEREQRQFVFNSNRIQLEDQVFKSYGVLKYARKLTLKDAMMLLSEVMLGLSLGILTFDKSEKFSVNQIITDIQPAVLNNVVNQSMSVDEVEIKRAQYIRNNLPDMK